MEIFRKFFAKMDEIRPKQVDSASWWEAVFDLKFRDIETYHAAKPFVLSGQLVSSPFAFNDPDAKISGVKIPANTDLFYRKDQRTGLIDVEIIFKGGRGMGDITLRVKQDVWDATKLCLNSELKRKRRKRKK